MKTSKGEIILIIAVLAILVYIVFTLPGNDRKRITSRMESHSEKVVEIDRCLVRQGPFWIGGKNYRIYQVTTENGEYWVRFNVFADPDIEKKTVTGYTEETL